MRGGEEKVEGRKMWKSGVESMRGLKKWRRDLGGEGVGRVGGEGNLESVWRGREGRGEFLKVEKR